MTFANDLIENCRSEPFWKRRTDAQPSATRVSGHHRECDVVDLRIGIRGVPKPGKVVAPLKKHAERVEVPALDDGQDASRVVRLAAHY